MQTSVVVIGAGVMGLTTAVRLLEAGYAVRVIARELPPNTTSNKAGAIWYPYLVEPQDLVRQWSLTAWHTYNSLHGRPDSGVSWLDVLVLAPAPIWWIDELPPGHVHAVPAEALPSTDDAELFGYQVRTHLVETPRFMPWLLAQVDALGGVVETQTVHDLDQLAGACDLVVNCSGLGAAGLAPDPCVYPIAGHIVPVEMDSPPPALMDERVDELETVNYIFPRQDFCVVGGSERVGDGEEVRPDLVERILQRAYALAPALRSGRTLAPYVGLRPGRDRVRLEMACTPAGLPVIHNYGHGGAGFTLCWGCADQVAGLL